MNIPQEIKDKIASRPLDTLYGYQLAKQEIEKLKSELDLMNRREVAWGQKVEQVEEEVARLTELLKARIL